MGACKFEFRFFILLRSDTLSSQDLSVFVECVSCDAWSLSGPKLVPHNYATRNYCMHITMQHATLVCT